MFDDIFSDVEFFPELDSITITEKDTGKVVTVKVDKQCEFLYRENVFIVYANSMYLRRHTTLYDYEDMHCQQFAIIEKDTAGKWLLMAATLCKNVIQIEGIEPSLSIDELVDEFEKDYIVPDSTLRDLQNMISKSLRNMNPEILEKCLSGIAMPDIKLSLTSKDGILQYSKVLTSLSEFFTKYANYNIEILSIHALSCVYDMVFLVLNYQLAVRSYFGRIFTDKEDILWHLITSLIFDIATDRCSYLLFLQGKSDFAQHLLRKIRRQYPFLSQLQTPLDLMKVSETDLSRFSENLECEPVRLFPHILAYNFDNRARVKFTIDCIWQQKTLNAEKVITEVLEPISNTLHQKYGRYDSAVVKILFDKIDIGQCVRNVLYPSENTENDSDDSLSSSEMEYTE